MTTNITQSSAVDASFDFNSMISPTLCNMIAYGNTLLSNIACSCIFKDLANFVLRKVTSGHYAFPQNIPSHEAPYIGVAVNWIWKNPVKTEIVSSLGRLYFEPICTTEYDQSSATLYNFNMKIACWILGGKVIPDTDDEKLLSCVPKYII